MKVFPGRLNWRSTTIRTSRGGTRSIAVPPESGREVLYSTRAKPSAVELQPPHWCPKTTRSRSSAGRISRRKRSSDFSPSLPWAQGRRRRNKSPKTNVGKKRVGPNGGPKSSKLMGGAPAQGRALQPGASAASGKVNPKVSQLASTDTYVRLTNLPFGHSGRAN
jgi:hypothetical protein